MKTKKQEFYLADCIINTESEVFDNEILDTQIFINDTYLCTIAGSDIDNFVNDLRELIKKYRI